MSESKLWIKFGKKLRPTSSEVLHDSGMVTIKFSLCQTKFINRINAACHICILIGSNKENYYEALVKPEFGTTLATMQ